MAGLSADQRDRIMRRCSGLVATYFTSAPLRVVDIDAERHQIADGDVEFHDYLLLSTLLPAGAQLCDELARVALAPAVEHRMGVQTYRGELRGPIDPTAIARRIGQRTMPRPFPIRRLTVHHDVPENVVAVSAALAVQSELQGLIARTQLPRESSEAITAMKVLDALDGALASNPLVDLRDHYVEPSGDEMTKLLAQVDERWTSRRISNRAYADIARWVAHNRNQDLRPEGLLPGLAYGEEFDNRLFEIFSLHCVRVGLEHLGFACSTARPLHLARTQPAMEFTHPDGAAVLDVWFQRAKGVAWTSTAPRHWPDLVGIPDIILSARSPSIPVVLLDAKNRARGPLDRAAPEGDVLVGRHATSDELHKMLGYFTNFERRTRVGRRGPCGGLLFSSRSGSTPPWTTRSDREGALVTIAIDPLDGSLDNAQGAAREFMEAVLRQAGLFGGSNADGSSADAELEAIHASLGEPASDEAYLATEDAIHAWVEGHYGSDHSRLATTEALLESHVLGPMWNLLTEEEQRFLATAEIFWQDHAGAVGMDFGPVVIEIAKAFESLAMRTVIDPFRAWAGPNGRQVGQVQTMGDIRAELQRVAELPPGSTRPRGARALADYLDEMACREAALDHALPVLARINPLRRDAAHPHRITNRAAAEFRSWTLGIGSEACAISVLVDQLATSGSDDARRALRRA